MFFGHHNEFYLCLKSFVQPIKESLLLLLYSFERCVVYEALFDAVGAQERLSAAVAHLATTALSLTHCERTWRAVAFASSQVWLGAGQTLVHTEFQLRYILCGIFATIQCIRILLS